MRVYKAHFPKCEVSVTKSSEARHKVHKGSCAIAKNGSKTQSELMTQGQQVVSNIHAVVMVNGSQLGELLKVLPRPRGRAEKETTCYSSQAFWKFISSPR